jgi:predicted transcriptional regulator of viral defense system
MTNLAPVHITPIKILNKTLANMDKCLEFVWTAEMNYQGDQILELARSRGVLRTRDVDSAGASRALLASLTDEGKLLKLGRGLYVLPDRAVNAYDSFAEVAARSESGVLCLLSALRFHDLTTQQSSDVWLAIPHKAHAPRFDYPPLRVVRMSGPAMTEGVETFDVAGTPVRVFSVAKTVADCFTFRNKIGLDAALEALREALNGKRATMDELWHYAEICRVANVMRPYLEAIGAA